MYANNTSDTFACAILTKAIFIYYNLPTKTVTVSSLKGPLPTTVNALTSNVYSVLLASPVTVYIEILFIVSRIILSLLSLLENRTRYSVMIPLGGSGGNHDKVTVVSVTSTIINDLGAVGAVRKHIQSINENYNVSKAQWCI